MVEQLSARIVQQAVLDYSEVDHINCPHPPSRNAGGGANQMPMELANT